MGIKMTAFERILYEVSSKTLVPKRALLNIGDSPYTIYHQIKRAIKMGLIKEKTLTINKVSCSSYQWTSDILLITTEGVRYVHDHLARAIPWASYIDTSSKKMIPFGVPTSRGVMNLRYGRITAAAVMATSIGAKDACMSFTDFYLNYASAKQDDDDDEGLDAEMDELLDDDGNTTEAGKTLENVDDKTKKKSPIIGNLIRAAYDEFADVQRQMKYDKALFTPADDYDIQFFDALTVKRKITQRSMESNTEIDVRGGRYSGILSSHIRTVLVYMATPASPLIWYRRFFEREVRALKIIKRSELGIANSPDESESGVLLTTDPDVFEHTYNGHLYKNAKKPKRGRIVPIPPCGSNLKHMWVIPYDQNGNAELRRLMTTDYDAEKREVIAKLIATGKYTANTKQVSPGTFPLQDSDGLLVAIGIHMEVNAIRNMETIAERSVDRDFAVGCFRWQIPYYKAILNYTNIIELDDDLPEYNQRWESMRPKLDVEQTAEGWNTFLGRGKKK